MFHGKTSHVQRGVVSSTSKDTHIFHMSALCIPIFVCKSLAFNVFKSSQPPWLIYQHFSGDGDVAIGQN